MNGFVYCNGCGQRIDVPEGYRRNKMRCPACGVMCPVPVAAKAREESAPRRPSAPKPPAPAPVQVPEPQVPERRPAPDAIQQSPQRAEEPRLLADTPASDAIRLQPAEDTPPRLPAGAFQAKPPGVKKKRRKKRGAKDRSCYHCGEFLGEATQCPVCGRFPAEPPPPVPPRERLRIKSRPLAPQGPTSHDEDDSLPYPVHNEGEVAECPRCQADMDPLAEVCPACGYKLEPLLKEFPPVDRFWEPNLPLKSRVLFYAALQGAALLAGLVTGLLLKSPQGFLAAWFLSSVVSAFLLGTYESLRVTRNARGRVTITKTWRVCFFLGQPTRVNWREMEALSSGMSHDAGFFEWVVFFHLVPYLVVPALVWWYLVIHKDTYFVTLTRDHGFPAVYLYRGRSPEQMEDVIAVVRQVTDLPYEC